jgi:Concanavalin A-like lectin/glucanases superfamily
MKKTSLLLIIILGWSVALAQSKKQLNPMSSNNKIQSPVVGCSLFTNPNNYTSNSSFQYNAPINDNSNLVGDPATNYGCLSTKPNQTWFIITVNMAGNLFFDITNPNNYDVDAAIWGPIINNDVTNACTATQNPPIACDYGIYDPQLTINNAQVGQKYVMLVTNFSNANTIINILQPTLNGNSANNVVIYSMANSANKLVSCYPFNGNAIDAKGFSNGTVGGATLTTDRFGNSNSAYSFSGSNFIELTQQNYFFNTEYTYAAWVQATNLPTSGSANTILSVSGGGQMLYIGNSSVTNNLPAWAQIVYTNENLPASPHPSSTTNVTTGNWHHVVSTLSRTQIKIYLDGILIRTSNFSSTITPTYSTNPRSAIGARDINGTYGQNFYGKIDDVQIYNVVLTAGQVQSLFNNSQVCYDATNYVCLSNSQQTSMLSGQQLIQVSNQITGNNIIQTSSNIQFDAGVLVLLQPGFSVENGAVFKAFIHGCQQ